jgi:hypothetical protein
MDQMTELNPQNQAHSAPEVDYDRHEPKSGLIAIISGVTIVVLVGMILGIYWLYVVAYETVDQQQYSGVPSKELEAIRLREADQLYKYSYIDKEKGIVRLPVDRAMEIVAAEFARGAVAYNTKTYAAKPEGPGGAAAPPAPLAPPSSPAPAGAAPGIPVTPAPPAASVK